MITVPSGPQSPSSLPASATGPQEAPEVVGVARGSGVREAEQSPPMSVSLCLFAPVCTPGSQSPPWGMGRPGVGLGLVE